MNYFKFLRKNRLKKGLTQKKVAEKLHIKDNTYSHYETGKRKIDIDTYVKLSEMLDIDLEISKPKYEKLDKDFLRLMELNDIEWQKILNQIIDNSLVAYSIGYLEKEKFEEFWNKIMFSLSKGRREMIYDEIRGEKKPSEHEIKSAKFEILKIAKKLIDNKDIRNIFQ